MSMGVEQSEQAQRPSLETEEVADTETSLPPTLLQTSAEWHPFLQALLAHVRQTMQRR